MLLVKIGPEKTLSMASPFLAASLFPKAKRFVNSRLGRIAVLATDGARMPSPWAPRETGRTSKPVDILTLNRSRPESLRRFSDSTRFRSRFDSDQPTREKILRLHAFR